MSSYKVKPGQLQRAIAWANATRDRVKAVLTAKEVFIVDLGDGLLRTVAVHGDVASLKAGEIAAEAIYAEMSDYIEVDTLKSEVGKIIWRL